MFGLGFTGESSGHTKFVIAISKADEETAHEVLQVKIPRYLRKPKWLNNKQGMCLNLLLFLHVIIVAKRGTFDQNAVRKDKFEIIQKELDEHKRLIQNLSNMLSNEKLQGKSKEEI